MTIYWTLEGHWAASARDNERMPQSLTIIDLASQYWILFLNIARKERYASFSFFRWPVSISQGWYHYIIIHSMHQLTLITLACVVDQTLAMGVLDMPGSQVLTVVAHSGVVVILQVPQGTSMQGSTHTQRCAACKVHSSSGTCVIHLLHKLVWLL